jgi:hypothetical protein
MASEKYPRTYHVPWSPNRCCDDKVLESVEAFIDKELIVTEKLDGGNCCLTREGVYARTHGNTAAHPSFAPVKAIWSSIQYDIPEKWSIFGESLYAKHSIHYKSLPSYFMVFGIRLDLDGDWLSWENTKKHAKSLGLETVPEMWRGSVDSEKDLKILTEQLMKCGSLCRGESIEGLVIRDANHFLIFKDSVAKYVRQDHIQTDEHWTNQPIIPNELRK